MALVWGRLDGPDSQTSCLPTCVLYQPTVASERAPVMAMGRWTCGPVDLRHCRPRMPSVAATSTWTMTMAIHAQRERERGQHQHPLKLPLPANNSRASCEPCPPQTYSPSSSPVIRLQLHISARQCARAPPRLISRRTNFTTQA